MNNLQVFRYLYQLEVILREFIRQTLSSRFGHSWRKRCIPNDIKTKMKAGIEYERSRNWQRIMPHDSIYYCDFGDLKKIILKRDNWDAVFKSYFRDPSSVEGLLQLLEPVRNTTAHNRVASQLDCDAAVAALSYFIECLGAETSCKLLEEVNSYSDMKKMLLAVRLELNQILIDAASGERTISSTAAYDALVATGFCDEDILGQPVDEIHRAYEAIMKVKSFPRLRGEGHKLESLLTELDFTRKLTNATEAIDLLGR